MVPCRTNPTLVQAVIKLLDLRESNAVASHDVTRMASLKLLSQLRIFFRSDASSKTNAQALKFILFYMST